MLELFELKLQPRWPKTAPDEAIGVDLYKVDLSRFRGPWVIVTGMTKSRRSLLCAHRKACFTQLVALNSPDSKNQLRQEVLYGSSYPTGCMP